AIIILSGTVTPAPITAHARRIANSSAFLAGISVILNCLPLSRLKIEAFKLHIAFVAATAS
ncbi:hypothetical protein C6H70_28335, partial [Klebsiella pneumoniae]